MFNLFYYIYYLPYSQLYSCLNEMIKMDSEGLGYYLDRYQ